MINREQVLSLLQEFDGLNGVSGSEEAIADCLKKYIEPVTNENYKDTLGNCVFIKKGKNPNFKVMLSVHMDEIGFMVCDVTDKGFVTIVPIGYHNPNILVNQVMTIHTQRGSVYGVVGGGKPIHQSMGNESSGFHFSDILIDVGAENPEEVEALGIRCGDLVNIEKAGHILNDRYFSGKAVDNRCGCTALVLIMQELQNIETEATIYACGTVQEEIGLKGAAVLTRRIDPDLAVCIDVGLASEQGELSADDRRFYMNKGPAIQMYDWSPETCTGNIVPRKMVRDLVEAAQKAQIPYQHSIMLRCGTDACAIAYNNQGIVTGGISIPEKYIHTSIGYVSIDDVKNAAKLIIQYLTDLK